VGRQILLVEDSELVTEALSLLLRASGHRVRVAGTVAEAQAAIDDAVPEVVLLDLSLPDGSGLEVARRIRDGSAPNPPVVLAMTGHDSPEVATACIQAGCRAVLVKPVASRELRAVLDAL
jgi:DNA-binding response OmpR family regulator